MPAEQRGQAIRVMIALVNWQQEEPNGCGGGQQLLLNGTSRVNREIYARFCERLGVKFPGPTRRWETGRRPNVSTPRPSSTLPPASGDQTALPPLPPIRHSPVPFRRSPKTP